MLNRMRCLAMAALLMWLPLLGGCAKQPEQASEKENRAIIVGFAQLGSESGWRVGNSEDIQRAAKQAGVELVFKNADQKQENQIKAIRSFIASQVDVIAFSPIVEDGWDTVLQEAKDAGIPVLLTDRFINVKSPSLYAGFVGSDFLMEGQAAAAFLLKRTAARSGVNIVQLTGTENSTPAKDRQRGFEQMIASNLDYRIVKTVSGDFLRSKGKERMQIILEETPSIDVLYSHNDAMTLGAIEAIEEAGLVPGRDIIIISVDGEQGAIDLLKQGKINCVVECTPMIGDAVMELSKKLAAGESIPRVTYSKERVFSEYDADLDSLPPRGY